jgi:hypothetical protein
MELKKFVKSKFSIPVVRLHQLEPTFFIFRNLS